MNSYLLDSCKNQGVVDNSITYLTVTRVKQLDSLPCQVNSALFARCLNHCRDAGEQHAAGQVEFFECSRGCIRAGAYLVEGGEIDSWLRRLFFLFSEWRGVDGG